MKKKTKGGLFTTVTSNEGCKIVDALSTTSRDLNVSEMLAIMNFKGIDFKLCKDPRTREIIGNSNFLNKK